METTAREGPEPSCRPLGQASPRSQAARACLCPQTGPAEKPTLIFHWQGKATSVLLVLGKEGPRAHTTWSGQTFRRANPKPSRTWPELCLGSGWLAPLVKAAKLLPERLTSRPCSWRKPCQCLLCCHEK